MSRLSFLLVCFCLVVYAYPDGTTIPSCISTSADMASSGSVMATTSPSGMSSGWYFNHTTMGKNTYVKGAANTITFITGGTTNFEGCHISAVDTSNNFIAGLAPIAGTNMGTLTKCTSSGTVIHKTILATTSVPFTFTAPSSASVKLRAIVVYSRTTASNTVWDYAEIPLTGVDAGTLPAPQPAPVAPVSPIPVAPAPVAPTVPQPQPTPVAPVAPVAPVSPTPVAPAPVSPTVPQPQPTPVAPVAPVAPNPVAPTPVSPTPAAPTPVAPVAPTPVAPVAPTPVAPVAPTPVAPVAPAPVSPTVPQPQPAPVAPTPLAPVAPIPKSPVAPTPVTPSSAGSIFASLVCLLVAFLLFI